MKVLFLDIDGVLNSSRDYQVVSDKDTAIFYRLNIKQVDMIKEIIEDTGCKIVLSSTWRLMNDGRETVECHGIPILDITPDISGKIDNRRGREIAAWLKEHPEVTKYCIVDDDGDMLDDQLRNFVQTTFEHGLTETHAYRIKYILNN